VPIAGEQSCVGWSLHVVTKAKQRALGGTFPSGVEQPGQVVASPMRLAAHRALCAANAVASVAVVADRATFPESPLEQAQRLGDVGSVGSREGNERPHLSLAEA